MLAEMCLRGTGFVGFGFCHVIRDKLLRDGRPVAVSSSRGIRFLNACLAGEGNPAHIGLLRVNAVSLAFAFVTYYVANMV